MDRDYDFKPTLQYCIILVIKKQRMAISEVDVHMNIALISGVDGYVCFCVWYIGIKIWGLEGTCINLLVPIQSSQFWYD